MAFAYLKVVRVMRRRDFYTARPEGRVYVFVRNDGDFSADEGQRERLTYDRPDVRQLRCPQASFRDGSLQRLPK